MLFLFEKPELLAEAPKFLTPETSKQVRRLFDLAELKLEGNHFRCLFPAKGKHFSPKKNSFPRFDAGYIQEEFLPGVIKLIKEIDDKRAKELLDNNTITIKKELKKWKFIN